MYINIVDENFFHVKIFPLTHTCESDMIDVCDVLAVVYALAQLRYPYKSRGCMCKVLKL